jgi:hypothetical protein
VQLIGRRTRVQRESSPALGNRHEHDPRRSHPAFGRYSPPTGLDSENADLFAHNTIVIADVVDDSSGRLGKPWPRSLEHQPQVRLRES